jgi:3-hydroxyanthranilate 3,4-dioxygenase
MNSKHALKSINLNNWIRDNQDKLKPPVGNAQVWEDGDVMVTVVGGPNARLDYHDDPTEEFFYQLKGDIKLRLIETPGQPPIEVPIREGEIFLLPAHIRHSPQRGPNTIGLVIEVPRDPNDFDAFEWYCLKCHHLVHRAEVALKSIVKDLPPVFEKFYGSIEARTCKNCGEVHPGKPAPPQA